MATAVVTAIVSYYSADDSPDFVDCVTLWSFMGSDIIVISIVIYNNNRIHIVHNIVGLWKLMSLRKRLLFQNFAWVAVAIVVVHIDIGIIYIAAISVDKGVIVRCCHAVSLALKCPKLFFSDCRLNQLIYSDSLYKKVQKYYHIFRKEKE